VLSPSCRELTPLQLALRKAVQQTEVQKLALREIARQLGISRNTVHNYARAFTQPANQPHNRGAKPLSQVITRRSTLRIRFPFKLIESLDNDTIDTMKQGETFIGAGEDHSEGRGV
jgi:IS30 family transposase